MKLAEFLETNQKTQAEAAEELETSSANVCRWANGDVLPSFDMMKKIISWSGGKVQPNDFYEEK